MQTFYEKSLTTDEEWNLTHQSASFVSPKMARISHAAAIPIFISHEHALLSYGSGIVSFDLRVRKQE